ncbi:TPA: hypothetical protein ACIRLG_000794, partial [Streptococcus suis]
KKNPKVYAVFSLIGQDLGMHLWYNEGMTNVLLYLFFLGILNCFSGYLITNSRKIKIVFYCIGIPLVLLPFILLIYFAIIL